jgi:butyrate kinase
MKLLIINPGSTSTKIGVFDNENLILDVTLRHDVAELAKYDKFTDQYDFRKRLILEELEKADISINDLAGIVDRGGLTKPLSGGTYRINERMVADLKAQLQGEHASNLGGIIAYEIGNLVNIPAFIVDPVVVDELAPISRISGHPAIERRSIFHALNQKAIARQFCKEKNLDYFNCNLIVVHMGGGISIGVHEKGRVIDVNNALDGDGPFSPERSGGLPVGDLVALCFDGKHTHKDIKAMIKGNGGMVAYFGTNNMKELEEKAETNPEIRLVLDALAYQIAKEIGAVSVAVCGKLDGILLTGGIAYSKHITSEIAKRTEFIAEVKVYPGEDELSALALGGLRVLRGEEEAKIYD